MDNIMISKKKLAYPVSSRFHLYLDAYGRELNFAVKYEDLWGWSEAIALEDKNGNDTLWETLIHPASVREELDENLKNLYCELKMAGDLNAAKHLDIDRIDFCHFANSHPFRIRVVNSYNDNQDYFYVKKADASRIYGLELEHLLSPNNIHFLVRGDTLIEEHIAGIPGDDFIGDYFQRPGVNKVRICKEFVKFNERCFIRLLGDMRAYNYVMDVTLDFDEEQYRVRAIDFDQQSYEGDIKVYLPQFHKENKPIVDLVWELLTVDTIRQYQVEERALMSRRAKASWNRIDDLLVCMGHDVLSSPEKSAALAIGLAHFHKNDDFRSCTGMGDLVRKNLEVTLGLEET
jgi:hypothetical protein